MAAYRTRQDLEGHFATVNNRINANFGVETFFPFNFSGSNLVHLFLKMQTKVNNCFLFLKPDYESLGHTKKRLYVQEGETNTPVKI